MTKRLTDEGQAACACFRVAHDLIHNEDGTCSERWVCQDCGTVFGKVAALTASEKRLRRVLGEHQEWWREGVPCHCGPGNEVCWRCQALTTLDEILGARE